MRTPVVDVDAFRREGWTVVARDGQWLHEPVRDRDFDLVSAFENDNRDHGR